MKIRVSAPSLEALVARWPEIEQEIAEARKALGADPRIFVHDRAVNTGVSGINMTMGSPPANSTKPEPQQGRGIIEANPGVTPNPRRVDKDELVELSVIDPDVLVHTQKPEGDQFVALATTSDEVEHNRDRFDTRAEQLAAEAEGNPSRLHDPEVRARFYVRREDR